MVYKDLILRNRETSVFSKGERICSFSLFYRAASPNGRMASKGHAVGYSVFLLNYSVKFAFSLKHGRLTHIRS